MLRRFVGTILFVLMVSPPFAAKAQIVQSDARQKLADWGVQLNATYIGESLGNVSGGIQTGATYTGRLDIETDVDLEKLVGWNGAKFHTSFFQIHGQGLSPDYIGNLMLVSGVEALPATRLYEFWIEQSLLGGALSVRVGQQASDVEFIDSKYDDLFVNSALGWPGITGINLPGGGPSPPLAVPGIRLKYRLANRLTAFLAIFDGYPAPPGAEDPQIANPHGLLFRVNDPPWLIGQIKYGFDVGAGGLPATVTAGAWYHFGTFNDQRFTAQGVSLADPTGSGTPGSLAGNNGLFAVYEQLLSRSTVNPDNGVGFFVRTSVSPSDRNLVSFYIDGGFQFTSFSASRPDDRFAFAMIYARISDAARQLDRDTQAFSGTLFPIRDYEAIFEMTYGLQIQPGFVLQPVFEYIMHPGGGAPDPNDPTQTKRIRDAVVFGVRTTINF